MSHTPNQISGDEKDLSEVKMHIMKKSIFSPKHRFKFVGLEKMKIGKLGFKVNLDSLYLLRWICLYLSLLIDIITFFSGKVTRTHHKN